MKYIVVSIINTELNICTCNTMGDVPENPGVYTCGEYTLTPDIFVEKIFDNKDKAWEYAQKLYNKAVKKYKAQLNTKHGWRMISSSLGFCTVEVERLLEDGCRSDNRWIEKFTVLTVD